MNLSPRLALVSGASAAGVAALMLGHRIEATVPVVLVLVVIVRAAGPVAALSGGVLTRAGADSALARQGAFVPAWGLAAAAAAVRAGSPVLRDVAGAHAVAGVGLARGPILVVAGMWLALFAVTISIGGAGGAASARTAAPDGSVGVVRPPRIGTRLEMLGVLGQVVLAATLFAGAQVRSATDVVPWIATGVGVAVWAWFGRAPARLPVAPWVAAGLAGTGLVLVAIGGRL